MFDFIVGGYGGFGVIVEATLSLTDNVNLIENGVEIHPRDYVSYFNHNVRDNDDIEIHLYRLSLQPKHLFQTGVAVSYRKISDEPVIACLVDEPELGSWKDRIKLHTLRRFSPLRCLAWNIEKGDALEDKVASRNEFMRPPINSVFNNSKIDTEWLQEYFVKGEHLAEFLTFLGDVLQKNNVSLFNASVRFVKQDVQTKLSYAQNGDRFAVVLFFNQKLSSKEIKKTKLWVRQVLDYLVKHDGSYYLPYQHFANIEQFRFCYPNWQSVISYKQTSDPDALFMNGLYQDYLSTSSYLDTPFRSVFDRVCGQRDKVGLFLNNVFMQLDEGKFFDLVDSILENRSLSDKQIYKELYKKIGQAKPNAVSGFRNTLRSLNCLKDEVGDQVALLADARKISGYVEIGYPGRMIRPLKSRLDMGGPFYVITDKKRLTDYVEAGFPLPHNQFVPLNDYEPIPENAIPTASVDLVCMYIGLHHVPTEKLDSFVRSIQRILKPGGMFILMDHDAYSMELRNFVDVIHSIFNVATGVTPELNDGEIRNFQSLPHWINLLESHGLTRYAHSPLIRKGDPSLNSLIRFDKPLEDPSRAIISEPFCLKPDEQRPQIHTYLTAPEWQNVRAAQRHATFVEKEPAYRFPYFSEIGGFWKVYGRSWQAARQQSSFSDVALSEYNLMNCFIGSTMTLEYGIKGVLSSPLILFDKIFNLNPGGSEKSPVDQERLRSLKAYGSYIENTPFYEYPYFQDIRSYWQTYYKQKKSLKAGLKGMLLGAGMTFEYGLKGLLSLPMSCLYGSETMKEMETTHVIIHDVDDVIETIDPAIIVVEACPGSTLKHIEVPRYMRFTEVISKIASETRVTCLDISGHDKIQIDVKVPKGTFPSYVEANIMYEIPAPTDLQYTHIALEVEVRQLCAVIRALGAHGADLIFIHDY